MGSELGLNLSAQAAIHYFPSVPVIADYYFTMEFHSSRTCRSMVVGVRIVKFRATVGLSMSCLDLMSVYGVYVLIVAPSVD